MNKKYFWLPIVGLCAILATTNGCKKKTKGGSGPGSISGSDQIDIIGSSDIYDIENLPDRPTDMGMTVAEGQSQFEPLYFDYDSSQVGPSETYKVEMVGDYLMQNPNVGIIIEGHCDERGSREYNLALAERRALAVRAYLLALGIDGSRIQTKSYGEENPVAFGHDAESWSLNRRGEFVLFY